MTSRESLEPQQAETSGTALRRYKKILIPVVAVVIVVIIAVVAYANRPPTPPENAEEYQIMAEQLMGTMVAGGMQSEILGELTYRVSENAKNHISDISTDPYTIRDKVFITDPALAVENLFAHKNTSSVLKGIESNRIDVDELLSLLQNPPAGMEACHKGLMLQYDAYAGLMEVVLAPPTTDFYGHYLAVRDKARLFVDAYNELKALLP
jgi:hypothetical protein